MKAYMTITARTPQDLDYGVNSLLRQGWKLLGGVTVSRDGRDYVYAQAMTHKKTKKIIISGLDDRGN